MRRHNSIVETEYKEKSKALNTKISRLRKEIQDYKDSLRPDDLESLQKSLQFAIRDLSLLQTNFRLRIIF